jgi:cbb3-type cytochrome oxidase maturation protein
MEILMLLIPLSVALALAIAFAFWWSVRSGQFDDLDSPAYRILTDDDAVAGEFNPAQTLTSVKPDTVPRR